MDTFLMICAVAADFGTRDGDHFAVTPRQIGSFIQAPAWIRDTLLFRLLLRDGSIKIALGADNRKQLENEPLAGLNAEGKKDPAEAPEAEAPADAQAPARSRKTRAKKGENE